MDYFIQCYLRLKNRHGHEVLNGEDESSKYVYISFLKLFQNFDFDKRLKSSEEYGKNIFFQIIDFTDEKSEIQIETNTEKFFNNVMRKIKPFDEFSIKKYFGNDIDEYFKAIEEKYDGKNFFEDTRELIKNEIEDLLKIGVIYDK